MAGLGQAGQERYDYDPIGRLIRFTDSNNTVTDYSYDAAGNIVSVTSGSAVGLAPVLSSISPSVIRRGETETFTLTGQRLQVGTLQAADSGLTLSNLQQTASQILVDLAAAPSTPLGSQTLTFSNALGSAQIALAVGPALPAVTVEPSPLALPPDNIARDITLRLSNSDVIAHTINLASSDTSKASVSPASVVIAAGQSTAQVSITPKAAGFVSLVLSSPTLNSTTVPVFVTADFRGVNTSYAAPVGVLVGQAQDPGAQTSATFAAAPVGIAVGPVLTGISPAGLTVGASHNLAIAGSDIPQTIQVAIVPAQDTTATWTVNAGGSSIALALEVAGNAAAGARQVVVTDGSGKAIPFVEAGRAQIVLTAGQPSIASIEPLFATAASALKIKIHGANLQNGRLVVSPASDLQIDAAPVVSADGAELTAGLAIAPLAATGPRVIQIVTPSGQTTAEPGSANQFSIVSELKEDITPILAPPVGITVGAGSQGAAAVGPVAAAQVGLSVGAAAYSVTPSAGILGSTVNLVVSGAGLQSVQTAALETAAGVSLGPLSSNAQGTQLTIPVSIAADAPLGTRRVQLTAAGGELIFSSAAASQFQIVAQAPELSSITPQVLEAGQTTLLSVHGKNLSDVTGVHFEPLSGLTAVPPFVASQGNTVLSFAVQVDATAATGTRTLIIDTAGESSSSAPAAGNTVQVAQQIGPTIGAILAPQVGLLVGDAQQRTDTVSFLAPLVGVMVAAGAQEARAASVFAGNVGVVVGAAATGIEPRSPEGYLKGASSVLVISGYALDQVTAVTATGAAGVSLGTPVANAAATELTVPVTVSTAAPSASYGVELSSPSGTATAGISATDSAAMLFNVGALPTAIDSVSPIVLEQGKSYTFTVRGSNLKDVYQMLAEPSTGIVFAAAPQWSTDALGEKLTVPLLIDSAAPIGSRVVRFKVAGGITGAAATPSNTITIVAPQ